MATRRQDIIDEVISRVSAITKTNGFSTNAGRNVYVGEIVKLGENEPDSAIAIVIGNETTVSQRVKVIYDLDIEIQALVKAQLDQPWTLAEVMIGDIKKAVELEDRRLGGAVNGSGTNGLERAGASVINPGAGVESGGRQRILPGAMQ